MFRSRILGACGALAFVGVACGGFDEPDLFSSSGGSTSQTDGGSGTKDSGTTTKDSGVGPVVDSGVGTTDAGVIIPPTTGLFCGDNTITNDPTYCTGEDICCESGGQIGSPSFLCGVQSSCKGTGDLVIPCDKSSECPGGKICCGTFVTGSNGVTPSYYSEVRCATSCTGNAARTFCDPDNGDDDCAKVGSGSTCTESSALPGFHVCS
ncbi:MAG: hypothetical protein ABI461_00295 [Polyangiaceae bacterium]